MEASKALFVRQFAPGKEKDQVPCDQFWAYQYSNKFQKIQKRLLLKLGFNDQAFSGEFASTDLKKYKLIVVQEMFSWNPLYVLRFLRAQNKTCKLFYWLRNTLFIEKYGTGITPQNIKNFLDVRIVKSSATPYCDRPRKVSCSLNISSDDDLIHLLCFEYTHPYTP